MDMQHYEAKANQVYLKYFKLIRNGLNWVKFEDSIG